MWIFLEDKLIVTKELNGQLLGLEDLDPVHQWFEHLLIAKIEKLKKDSNGTWMFESISSNVFNNQPGLVFSPIFCLFFLWKRMNWVLLEQILTLCSLDTSINYFFFYQRTVSKDSWDDYMGSLEYCSDQKSAQPYLRVPSRLKQCIADSLQQRIVKSLIVLFLSVSSFSLLPIFKLLQMCPLVIFSEEQRSKCRWDFLAKSQMVKSWKTCFNTFKVAFSHQALRPLRWLGELAQGEDLIESNYLPITIFLL